MPRFFDNTNPLVFTSFFGGFSCLNEPSPDRYGCPASPCAGRQDCPSSLIQASGSARGPECPSRGHDLYVVSRALSPKLKSTCQAWIYAGLKNSFRFINVQAITNILAAILTRILVRMPFSAGGPPTAG